ncbi:hypothetical protein BESB_000040 [Besnoitia besnoiti]|uniref:Uncharacterized protein n=1 Tax=Besnoitia besnoiti TaxID=94643 RepID=A0A2A9MPE4_BESBE|nr:hypothetical protein BESB_000040 [Besnoitia besnoiti]PFH37662.1 hypothetical protein BESB_000040 [Besnoitia besnoiti]
MEDEPSSGVSPTFQAGSGSRRKRLRAALAFEDPSPASSSFLQERKERRRRERGPPPAQGDLADPVSRPPHSPGPAGQSGAQLGTAPTAPGSTQARSGHCGAGVSPESPLTTGRRRGGLQAAPVSSRLRSGRPCAAELEAERGSGEEKSFVSARKRKLLSAELAHELDGPSVTRMTPARRRAPSGPQAKRRKRGVAKAPATTRRGGRAWRSSGVGGDGEGEDPQEEVKGKSASWKRAGSDEVLQPAEEGSPAQGHEDGAGGGAVSSSELLCLLSLRSRSSRRKEGEPGSCSSSSSMCSPPRTHRGRRRAGAGVSQLDRERVSESEGSSARARSGRRRREEEQKEGDEAGAGDDGAPPSPAEDANDVQSEKSEKTRSTSRRRTRVKKAPTNAAPREHEEEGDGPDATEDAEGDTKTPAGDQEVDRQAMSEREYLDPSLEGDSGDVKHEGVNVKDTSRGDAGLLRSQSSGAARSPSFAPPPMSSSSASAGRSASPPDTDPSLAEPFCSPCCSPSLLYISPVRAHAPTPGPPSLVPSPRQARLLRAGGGPAEPRDECQRRSSGGLASQGTLSAFGRGGEGGALGAARGALSGDLGGRRGEQESARYQTPKPYAKSQEEDFEGLIAREASEEAKAFLSQKKTRRRNLPAVAACRGAPSRSFPSAVATALSGQPLPPPLSPFDGPLGAGAEGIERRGRRQRMTARPMAGRDAAGLGTAEAADARFPCAQGHSEEDGDFDDLGSPCLPYSREEEEAKALFPHPRRQAMKILCSSARSSISRLSVSSRRGFSPCAAVGVGPPDLWNASPCAGDSYHLEASGRISAFSSFPSSPSSAHVYWSSASPTLLGAGAPGSYFGASSSLDLSTSSQMSTSSASSSVIFARPVLVKPGDGDYSPAGDADEGSVQSRGRSRRGSRKKHAPVKASCASPSARTSKGGCVFRLPSPLSRGGRGAGVAAGAAADEPEGAGVFSSAPCAAPLHPRQLPLLASLSRGGPPLGLPACLAASGAAGLASQNASASLRNPLSSENMLLSASWGVSFHRSTTRAYGAASGSLLGSATPGAAGGAIPQSSPLVRRARRLSEGEEGAGSDALGLGKKQLSAAPGAPSCGDARKERDAGGAPLSKFFEAEEGEEGKDPKDSVGRDENAEVKRKPAGSRSSGKA